MPFFYHNHKPDNHVKQSIKYTNCKKGPLRLIPTCKFWKIHQHQIVILIATNNFKWFMLQQVFSKYQLEYIAWFSVFEDFGVLSGGVYQTWCVIGDYFKSKIDGLSGFVQLFISIKTSTFRPMFWSLSRL